MAEYLVMDRTTLTRNLRPLEREGFVQIKSGTDKRTKLISLTEAGRAKFSETLPFWEETQRRVREGLGTDRASRLSQDLQAAVDFTRAA